MISGFSTKINECQKTCSQNLRVPGTRGTRANDAPELAAVAKKRLYPWSKKDCHNNNNFTVFIYVYVIFDVMSDYSEVQKIWSYIYIKFK